MIKNENDDEETMTKGTATPIVALKAETHKVSVSKKELNRQHHALRPHGNYHNYYFHRTDSVPDARLSLLPASLFLQKRVLDLGCNSGKLTLEVVQYLGAERSLGVDLDPYLVEQANENLTNAVSTNSTSSGCCGPVDVKGRVSFERVDFMSDSLKFFNSIKGLEAEHSFDTILLLSITKWLHLNHGDSGLISLFKALYDYLPDSGSGSLVVEPQEWENYKSATKKNPALRPVFKQLNLRPPFVEELKECGFILEETIERREGGFSRPLMIWTKRKQVS